jgi:hypothetical protein
MEGEVCMCCDCRSVDRQRTTSVRAKVVTTLLFGREMDGRDGRDWGGREGGWEGEREEAASQSAGNPLGAE